MSRRHRARTLGVLLITGASSGIGRACALRLARRGYPVFGTTRHDPEPIEDELRQLLPPSQFLRMVTMNVDDAASVTAGVERVLQDAGSLDGVINCAGVGLFGAVEETSDEEARALLETNLLGVMRVCRAVLPVLRHQGRGKILNISSIGGRIGLPYQGLYSATKFALEGLTEAMRMEAAPGGVQVVLIEPGDVHTQFTDRRKRVQASRPGSIYRETEDHVLSVVEKDERGGAHPESVARLVERVLTCRSPRVRYTVGPRSQRGAVELKRVLPSQWFEWALSKYYGVPPCNGRRS